MKVNDTLKKFSGLYILLLLLIPVTILVSAPKTKMGDLRSKAEQAETKIYFWPSSAQLSQNQSYDIEIRVTGEPKPSSLDLVLSFDPKVVSVEGNGPLIGDIYSIYQARFADNTKGVVGIGGRGEVRDGIVFASIKIKTIGVGNPNFLVNYLNSGDTKLSVDLPKYQVF